MFLCDVALGEAYKLTHSEYVTKLPDNCGHTYGMGSTTPDYSKEHEIDGVKFPGALKPIERNINSSLLYNEFIVYNTKQIKIRYVLEVEFLYKNGCYW